MREAEVDGNSARLLFGKAVGIRAGEGFDQRALAVGYMPAGGQHEMARNLAEAPGTLGAGAGPVTIALIPFRCGRQPRRESRR